MKLAIGLGPAMFVLMTSTLTLADEETEGDATATHLRARPVHGMVGGGIASGQLFGLGTTTVAMEAGAVMDPGRYFGMTLGADVELGRTSDGELSLGEVAPFFLVEARSERVRAGIGPQLAYFWIDRARGTGNSPIDALGVGVRARLTVDLFQLDDEKTPGTRRALYFAASPTLEYFTGDVTTWRANATLGVRF